jgi:hypothetical protein
MFFGRKRLPMSSLRSLPPTAAVALLLIGSAAVAQDYVAQDYVAQDHAAQDQPKLQPTHDVEITYDVTRPQQPRTRERVRWLAGEHLERVEASGRSTTIFDRDAHTVTLLTPANRTYRKLDGAPRRPLEPEPGAILKRGNDAVVAGLPCTDWSWTEDGEMHTICATTDGVMLRLVVDGAPFFEARSVKYAPQKVELFQVPPNYAPVLAPDGGAEP